MELILLIYIIIGLFVVGILWYLINFLKLTLINKILLIVISLLTMFLWPVIIGYILVYSARSLTPKALKKLKKKLEEIFE